MMSETNNTSTYSREDIGAFVSHGPDSLKSGTEGPLSGLTFAVKDLFDIAGYKSGGGSPEWLASHEAAQNTSPLVDQLLDSGAECVGKTICDELFYSFVGVNVHYGTPRNVNSPGRVPGGSSSGSAAATAAGLCDFALGSDTGGSVRIPASFCGLFSLRPTHSRLDLSHAMPMAPSFDAAGWFARDSATFLKVASVLLDANRPTTTGTPKKGDSDNEKSPVRNIIIADFAFEQCDRAVAEPLKSICKEISNKLSNVEHLSAAPRGLDFHKSLEAFRIIQAYETWQSFGSWIEKHDPKLGPGIRERMLIAKGIEESEQKNARIYQREVTGILEGLVDPETVLCLPPAASLPPPLQVDLGTLDDFRRKTLSLVSLASLSGLPQLTIPATRSENCAVGISLLGCRNSDETLCDLAGILSGKEP
ncbi:MAG: amidase [Desulfobulbia bacterium]